MSKKVSKKTKKRQTRCKIYGQQPNVVPHPLSIPLSKEMFCHKWRKNLTPLRGANKYSTDLKVSFFSLYFKNNFECQVGGVGQNINFFVGGGGHKI